MKKVYFLKKISSLEQIVEDLQKKVTHGLSSDLEENKEKLRTKQRELEELRNQFNQEKNFLEQLMQKNDEDSQQQIQHLQEEKNRLEGENIILERLLDEKKVECQEISSRLKDKEKKISQLVIEDNQDELENFRKEKNMLEGELLATERDKSHLEQKLIEIQKRLQSNKKKFSKPPQEQPKKSNSSSTLSHEERAELEEKKLKKNHPNLVKLLNEAKGKLSDSDYK